MAKNLAKRLSALDVLSLKLAAVAPERDPAAYEHHTQKYFEDCQPEGAVEIHLVKVIARTAWWLHYLPAVENNLLSEAMAKRQESVPPDQPQISSGIAMAMAFRDQSKVLDKLSLHEQRLSILFSKSLTQLHKNQADRREDERKQMQNDACGPSQDGFVLSPGKIETRNQRNERLKQAWNAPYHRA